MKIYVKQDDSFHCDEAVSKECPHCGAVAQLVPLSTPSFSELSRSRPRFVGVAFRCAACSEPRFARIATRAFGPDGVELSSHFVEVERPREHFAFAYLPDNAARVFREALDCYTAHCHLAFATMCRRTFETAAGGDDDRRRFSELFDEAVMLGNVDTATARTLRDVLLGTRDIPEITASHSAVLIELVKDVLYERYVRTAKLKAALRMRRHFADADEAHGVVTPIDGRNRRAESA